MKESSSAIKKGVFMEPTMSNREDKKFPMATASSQAGAAAAKQKPNETIVHKLQNIDIEKQFEEIKDQTKSYVNKTESVIKDHPFYAVLGAATVGATVGYLARLFTSRKH